MILMGSSLLSCTYSRRKALTAVSAILLLLLIHQHCFPSGYHDIFNDFRKNYGEKNRFLSSGGSLSVSFAALISLIDEVVLNNTVVLTVANPAYGLFLENWDCYAKPLIGRRFLVYTNDYDFGRRISERDGYHVLVQDSADTRDLKKQLYLGTTEYQRLVLARTELVAQLLEIGKSVLITDNDAVWFSNPLPYLEEDSNADIVSNTDGSGLYGKELCGGFLYLKHTPTTIRVWSEVTKEHEDIVARAISSGAAFFDESEQTVLNRIMYAERDVLSTNIGGIKPLRIHFLDTLLFPSGRVYFDLGWPQAQNLTPVVVHNDWLVGYQRKVERFKRFGLWRVGDEDTAAWQVDAGGGHRCAARYLQMEGIDTQASRS